MWFMYLFIIAVIIGVIYLWRTSGPPGPPRVAARVVAPPPVASREEQLQPLTIATKAPVRSVVERIESGMPDETPTAEVPAWYLKGKQTTSKGGVFLVYAWGTTAVGDNVIVDIRVESTSEGCRVTQDVTLWEDKNDLRLRIDQMDDFRKRLISIVRRADTR